MTGEIYYQIALLIGKRLLVTLKPLRLTDGGHLDTSLFCQKIYSIENSKAVIIIICARSFVIKLNCLQRWMALSGKQYWYCEELGLCLKKN